MGGAGTCCICSQRLDARRVAAGGRKFAFVDTFTIRRVREQLPDVQPAEWVQRYLAHIPDRT